MKIRTEFTAEIDVEFTDPQKAEAFMRGPFKESFFTMEDLKELAQHLAFVFDGTPGQWIKGTQRMEKFIEGFGSFYRGENWDWHLAEPADIEEIGNIIISYEMEIEPSHSYVVESV